MSCYILSQQNPLRIFCYKVLNHSKFESFIMFLIVGSSFKLVFDTYTDNLKKDDPIVILYLFTNIYSSMLVIKSI